MFVTTVSEKPKLWLYPRAPDVPGPADFHTLNCPSLNVPKKERNYEGRKIYWQHRTSVGLVLASSKEGCLFCAAVWSVLSQEPDFEAHADEECIYITLSKFEPLGISSIPMAAHYSLFSTSAFSSNLPRDLSISRDSALSRRGVFKYVPRDPASSQCLTLAKSWLQDCVRDHERCQQDEHLKSPSRLLQIVEGDLRFQQFRIIETQDERVPYTALSHCWGNTSSTLQSLKSNIEHHKNIGVNWNQMPKTFRDAIVVSQALGITFVWIDSLCIVQDDRADWENESARMKDVYQAATVVIAAMSSPSDEHGFLSVRPQRQSRQINIGSREIPSIATVARRVDHEAEHKESDLSCRGWTFQERLVAKRVLSFKAEEMTWECNSAWHCECGARDRIPRNKFAEFQGHMLAHIIDNANQETLHRVWRRNIVVEYSKRALTKRTDKLPAISAIAKMFLERFHEVSAERAPVIIYAAGLWYDTEEPASDETISGLLWRVSDSDLSTTTSPPFCAPSWSWASIDGDVDYTHVHEKEGKWYTTSEISDLWCLTSSKDTTGEVAKGSYITMRGQLSPPLQLRHSVSEYEHYEIDSFYGHNTGLPGETGFWNDCPLAKLQVPSPSHETASYTARRRHHNEEPEENEVDDVLVWCLHLATAPYEHAGRSPCYSLVLGKVETNPDKFCRLGILQEYHGDCQRFYKRTAFQDATGVELVDVMNF